MTAPADAQQGHNSGDIAGVNELREKALFFKMKERYQKALANKKTAAKEFLDECKRITKIGVEVSDIKFAIETDEDKDGVLAERYARRVKIAAWMRHPIGHQFDILDQPDRKPLIERAQEEGFEAGSTDKAMSANPYEPGADGYQPWIQGWHLGTEHAFDLEGHMRAEANAAKAEAEERDETEAAPAFGKRRSRPKGAKNKPRGDAAAAPAEVDDSIPTETASEEPAVGDVEVEAAQPAAVVDTTFADRRAARAAMTGDDGLDGPVPQVGPVPEPEIPEKLRRTAAPAAAAVADDL